ncbi:hypothetical protein IQ37_14630 [Chryseobacterium piperi]|uniref:Phosphoribulokinase/uridine kinase domain-containing protein n=1 Tax=Chryseobacterium piperi TaxID=558152 RepID=A0A086B2H8_9FLAO|nr:hypothetical protein [Chryseobacterium piperi]ASW73068.1 hypothetical protein CJF12_01365 [Chryseobacterium piperi]KFF23142.1 hypothetical protein IQ37_14630 [Chryseobacterium piperi]
MIGDVIELQEKHLLTAESMYHIIEQKLPFASNNKLTIGICGESGSGKSITAFALQKVMEQNGVTAMVLQMDDYFKLPPKDNHENRKKSLDNVGTHEVQLNSILDNLKEFKAGKAFIEKPLINYQANSVSKETVKTEDIQVLIIEGTYILDIEGFDFSIFIDRNYKDTYENRMKRNRDEQSDFIEKVLSIEHQIIRNFKDKANLILDKNYQIIMP